MRATPSPVFSLGGTKKRDERVSIGRIGNSRDDARRSVAVCVMTSEVYGESDEKRDVRRTSGVSLRFSTRV